MLAVFSKVAKNIKLANIKSLLLGGDYIHIFYKDYNLNHKFKIKS